MSQENKTIGITGGIGSGKSVVARILRCNGFVVYDCDREAKRIMKCDRKVIESLVSRFGDDIYHTDGALNKNRLAAEMFSNQETREFVNLTVHSAVRNHIKETRESVKGIFFIESAIIATGGLVPICDEIWIVTADHETRIKRVKERDKLSKDEILKRIETQEKEKELLDHEKIIFIENDFNSTLLLPVLKLTDRNLKYQTYKISC